MSGRSGIFSYIFILSGRRSHVISIYIHTRILNILLQQDAPFCDSRGGSGFAMVFQNDQNGLLSRGL